ncbi:fimbrillin family protein [Alloprevotella tannerae]|uniref:fimbrillin family protein n=1 Tax=Alloprevotella tannerae TaxID=76122 RepID=UPI0028F0BDD1|nr:fimbrillin family protein [Alloprevotella tannerae]
MKKVNILLGLLLSVSLLLISACSNQAETAVDEKAGPEGCNITFSFSNANFSASDEGNEMPQAPNMTTKGKVVSSTLKELGDGLEAEVQVEESTPVERTTRRVVAASPGNYTILAYQGTEKKGEWKGYFNGSKYTPAAGTEKEIMLTPGDYDFYVFNDKLTLQDGKIVTSLSNASEDALFAKQTVKVLNQKKQTVNFELKPAFAKLFLKINGFSNNAFNGATTGSFTYEANKIPQTISLDPTSGNTSVAMNPTNNTLPVGSFTANQANGAEKSYIKTEKGMCFLPNTDITQLKFKFADNIPGTVYGKSAKGKVLTITNPISGNLQAGKYYTVNVTIYYKADYLFSDGVVGTLMNNKGRTPVALVVDTKIKKTAIALNNSGLQQWTKRPKRINNNYTYIQNPTDLKKAINNYDGYEETWDRNYTKDPHKIVKGMSVDFPAFQAAANYSAPIKGNNWYLPGAGDWNAALKFLGIDLSTNGLTKHNWTGPLGYKLVEILFYQAGGTPLNTWYWAANEWRTSGASAITIWISDGNELVHFGGSEKRNPSETRAFIHF